MDPWDCCRMCLGIDDIKHTYEINECVDKYDMIVYICTGVKMEVNDCLPQHICIVCSNYISEIYKFRKKCEDSQKILQIRLQDKLNSDQVKVESHIFIEECTEANNTSLRTVDNDFNDADIYCKDFGRECSLEASENVNLQSVEEKNNKMIKSAKKMKPVRKRLKEKAEKEKGREREEIECEYCHKILTSKLSLRNHYKIHTGFDVVCEHCGKKFITRRLLLMHCRAKHGYEKTDKCSYCDYKASNAEQVKIHERLHTGEKPYVCKECNAGFHRKSSYLQHIAIHLPEKTVQCDQCSARFKSVTLMRIHRNRHRAPRYTFRCRICDNSFARRRNVIRHLQRIHGLQPQDDHVDRLKIS